MLLVRQACGVGNLATKPKQFFANPMMSNHWVGAICVDECPAPAGNAEIDKYHLVCICNPSYWPAQFGNDADRPADRSDELITGCAATDVSILKPTQPRVTVMRH